MEHSYYQKGTHRNTHQNGTLILSKWNTHQNGILIKMEHSYYQKKKELIGTLIKMEHSYQNGTLIKMEYSSKWNPHIIKRN